jgi:F0F1-type ATP synthase assembly protein I
MGVAVGFVLQSEQPWSLIRVVILGVGLGGIKPAPDPIRCHPYL